MTAILSRIRTTFDAAHAVVLAACSMAAVVLLTLCLLRWRTPPSGVECQYITAALHAKDTITGARQLVLALLHWHFSLGNTSLIGNLLALPFLWALPGRNSMLWLATITTCITAVVLLHVLVRRLCTYAPREEAALAGMAAGLLLLLSPLTLISAVSFTGTAPALMCMIAALLAYQWARRRNTPAAWCGASFVLLLSWYAKPEWGLLFIPAMLLVYCTEEWVYGGWRGGLAALATFAGVLPCVLLAVHRWQADTASLAVALGSASLAGVWLVWLQLGGMHARRALAFALPAVWIVLVWLMLFDNASMLLSVVRQHLRAHDGLALAALYLRQQWCATPVACVVVAALAIAGIPALLPRWPGLLALVAVLAYLAVRVPLVPPIQAVAVYAVVACFAAAGAVRLVMKCAPRRLSAWPRLLRAAVIVAALLIIMLPGLPRALSRDVAPAHLARIPLFDRHRAGWQALALIFATVPPGASVVYTPATSALSHLTLDAYARLYGFAWDVQPWPATLGTASPQYAVLVTPGAHPLAQLYFGNPELPAYCAVQRAALNADARFRLLAETAIADDTLTVSIFHRKEE